MSLSALHLHVGFGSRIHRPQIGFGPLRHSHDPRNQHDQNFVFLMICLFIGEEITQERNLRQRPGASIKGLGVRALEQAA